MSANGIIGKQFPTRATHKKSRNGCISCKRRHVKCDEQWPCGNCIRRNLECKRVLPPAASQASRALAKLQPAPKTKHPICRPSARDHTITLPGPSSPLAEPSGFSPTIPESSVDSEKVAKLEKLVQTLKNEIETISQHTSYLIHAKTQSQSFAPLEKAPRHVSPEEWIEDLHLFHHYVTRAYASLANDSTRQQIWREYVPQLACSHPFLMHGLLAVSALHLAHLDPAQHPRYSLLSTTHQTLALDLFSPALAAPLPTTPASLLLGSLIFLLNTSPLAHASPTPTPAAIARSLALLRGTRSLLTATPHAWRAAQSGPLAPLFRAAPPHPAPAGPFVARLDALFDACRGIAGAPACADARGALLLAVEALRHTYAVLAGLGAGARDAGAERVWTWAVVVPEGFLGMVGEGRPVAMVVLAYFAVLVRGFEGGAWWLEGWSGGVVGVVEGVVRGSEWEGWAEWAVRGVREGVDVMGMEEED